jgi:hypothetical protein
MGMKNKINRMITHQINPIFFVVKSVEERNDLVFMNLSFLN